MSLSLNIGIQIEIENKELKDFFSSKEGGSKYITPVIGIPINNFPSIINGLKEAVKGDINLVSPILSMNDPKMYPVEIISPWLDNCVNEMLRLRSFNYLKYLNAQGLERAFQIFVHDEDIPTRLFVRNCSGFRHMALKYVNSSEYKKEAKKGVKFGKEPGWFRILRFCYTKYVPRKIDIINMMILRGSKSNKILNYWLEKGAYRFLPDVESFLSSFERCTETQVVKRILKKKYINRVLKYFPFNSEHDGLTPADGVDEDDLAPVYQFIGWGQ